MTTPAFNFSRYVNYFRLLAASHSGIAHDLASELPDADKNTRHFALFTSDEVVSGLRSTIGDGIVLLLHPYFPKPGTNDAGFYYTDITCSFLLVKKVDHKDVQALTTTLNQTEEVLFTLLGQIIHDSKEYGTSCPIPKAFDGVSWNDVDKIEPLMHIFDGRAGWYCEFTYRVKQSKWLMNPALHNEPTTWLAVGDPQQYPLQAPEV